MVVFICCEAKLTHGVLQALGCAQSFLRCFLLFLCGFFFSAVTPSATGGTAGTQVLLMGKGRRTWGCRYTGYAAGDSGLQHRYGGLRICRLCWGWPLMEQLGGQVGLLLGVGLSVFTAIDGLMLVFLFCRIPRGACANGWSKWPFEYGLTGQGGIGEKAEATSKSIAGVPSWCAVPLC